MDVIYVRNIDDEQQFKQQGGLLGGDYLSENHVTCMFESYRGENSGEMVALKPGSFTPVEF